MAIMTIMCVYGVIVYGPIVITGPFLNTTPT